MENRDERRVEHRPRTLKGGRIVYNGGYSVAECTIRNLSGGGAMIELPHLIPLPSEFLLKINQDHDGHHCRVTWREGTRLGVAFVGPPEHHEPRKHPVRRRDEAY